MVFKTKNRLKLYLLQKLVYTQNIDHIVFNNRWCKNFCWRAKQELSKILYIDRI